MPTTTITSTTSGTSATTASALVPYLCVHDAAAAIEFYVDAFGAAEAVRILDGDGRVGHAELRIGDVGIFLSDEYPEAGVVSPRTLDGTSVTLHLTVGDVDAVFGRAVDRGASELGAPADMPHGARHGTLRDPFGHRWMISTEVEDVSAGELTRRMADVGMTVEASAAPPAPAGGGIWAAVIADDAPAMIRFLREVVGFEEQLVVPGADPDVIEHSQLRWPEGGVVQVSSAGRHGDVFSERPTGQQSLYVITADPAAVHERCAAAGLEVVFPPTAPDYDPGGTVFTVRDAEGNLWSFGTYGGES
jgi:PhnB protein